MITIPRILIRNFKNSTISFKEPLFTSSSNDISKYFTITFARSQGAGGQHVNTTDSKAIIRLESKNWYSSRGKWIPSKVFDNIMKNFNDKTAPIHKKFQFFTQSGDVLITSSTTRYRDKNLEECFNKFIKAVNECGAEKEEVSEETTKHWDKLKKRDNENRLKDKKQKKDKKAFRKKVSISDY